MLVGHWMEESAFESFPMLVVALAYIQSHGTNECRYVNCGNVELLQTIHDASLLPGHYVPGRFLDEYKVQLKLLGRPCSGWSDSQDGWFAVRSEVVTKLPAGGGAGIILTSMRSTVHGAPSCRHATRYILFRGNKLRGLSGQRL